MDELTEQKNSRRSSKNPDKNSLVGEDRSVISVARLDSLCSGELLDWWWKQEYPKTQTQQEGEGGLGTKKCIQQGQ